MTTTIFTETIRQSADKGSLVGPIFIDLAKVFDTIRHSLVLIKLQLYGILGTELAWFTDYLFNRHCIVNYPSSAQCFDLNRLFRWNRSREMTTTIFTETVRRSVLLKKNPTLQKDFKFIPISIRSSRRINIGSVAFHHFLQRHT